jgi:hypothetical protein
MMDPVFIDIEASGWSSEGGFPVEIGWASADGAGSFLIRPHETWCVWSEQSEAIHGISRPMLLSQGLSCLEAVQRLEAALGSRQVFSDNPVYDQDWLGTLYGVFGLSPGWHLQDGNSLLVEAARARGVNYDEAKQLAKIAKPHRHRAQSDAEHALEVWRFPLRAD